MILKPKNFTFILVLLLVSISNSYSKDKIIEINFSGLSKTDVNHLHNFIHSAKGESYDSLLVLNDVQRLRNTRLFLDVDVSIEELADGKKITFECEELITLLPIINFGGVSNNFWYQIGAADYNWIGKGYTLGGFYRYYDRHSFKAFLSMPYLFNSNWGLSTEISNFATIEPTYINDIPVDYNVDHFAFILEGRFNFSQNTAVHFGGGYLNEQYEKNEERTGTVNEGPQFASFDKYLFKLQTRHNFMDYYFHYLSGFSNELNLESVITDGEKDTFWKLLNITKFFQRIGERGNLALRLRVGLSTNKMSPFVPFVLDNYVNVRGSGNRTSRGTAELTINIGYRHSFWETDWGAVQSVVFTDMSAWRSPGGTVANMFTKDSNVSFLGLGLRFHLRKFNNFVFRVDYGFSVTKDNAKGIVFGAGQYF